MKQVCGPNHPLRRLFAGLVEHAFYVDLGAADPSLTNYLAEMLSNFVHVDNIFALRNARGKRLGQVAEMLAEAEIPGLVDPAERAKRIHKHIGDFTLFWTGVYPEILPRLCGPDHKDHLLDYYRQGKTSYAIAAKYTRGGGAARIVFRRLADHFELCVVGLGLVRKGWERLDPDSAAATRRNLAN